MTKTSASTGTPGVTREFVGMDSPTARRAGSGGHPCQGLYHRGVGRKPKVAMIAVTATPKVIASFTFSPP